LHTLQLLSLHKTTVSGICIGIGIGGSWLADSHTRAHSTHTTTRQRYRPLGSADLNRLGLTVLLGCESKPPQSLGHSARPEAASAALGSFGLGARERQREKAARESARVLPQPVRNIRMQHVGNTANRAKGLYCTRLRCKDFELALPRRINKDLCGINKPMVGSCGGRSHDIIKMNLIGPTSFV